jgi:hypothetical protein
MPIPRRLLAFLLVAILPALVLVLWITWPRYPPGITLQNFDRLRLGMTVGQVSGALGSDPRPVSAAAGGRVQVFAWSNDELEVIISFHDGDAIGGRMIGLDGVEVRPRLRVAMGYWESVLRCLCL